MFAPNHLYRARPATAADADALRRLAELDSRPALSGDVVVLEHDGALVAALALADGRAISDPFRPSAHAVTQLRQYAAGVVAVRRTPSLAERVRAAVRIPVLDVAPARI